ncbi:MAG: glutathione S-transferase family protein [Pseudohongiella sp.]|uniref:glutathione S-transferase family protein n=1 Tax=Pseudohongiella sp. TaxID=1979412 RepID=UPI0034A0972F
MKLVIGNKNYSSWSLRSWLLLSHHELPFEEVRIPLDQDDTYTTLAKYTEAGKVPVLQDGNLTVWDSLAICEYISEQYLEGRGWPSSVRARAEARSCSAEMHSSFPAIRGQLPMNCRASQRHVSLSPDLAAEVVRMDRIWSKYREAYSRFGPWLFGEFSIADCMFAPVASRFETYGIGLSEMASQYMRCLLSHEKVQEWVEQARAEPETIEMAEVGI